MVTLEEYSKLTEVQKKKLHKDQLKTLVDNHLLINQPLTIDNPDDIRNLIINTVTESVEKAIDNKAKELVEAAINGIKVEYDDELKTLRNDLETVTNENKVIKKIISEQEKFLETVRTDKIKNNIFISGIPNRVNIGGVQTEDNETIISHILLHLVPTITADDYSIIIAFEHREGFTMHSAIVSFTDCKTKEKLLGTCKKS